MRQGFTLIELLVVIAIIAVLAAMLFPVFARAREKSRTAMCQTHQKQLCAALMMYTGDYNDKLPWFQFLTWHDFGGSVGMIHLYDPYVKNDKIVICPSKQAYGYNEHLTSPLASDTYGSRIGRPEIQVYAPNAFPGRGRPLSDIASPALTPVFFDTFQYHPGPDGKKRGFGWGADDAVNPVRHLNNHNEGSNYAFLDGHVCWYRPQGGGFHVVIEGMDYDGNGSVGTATVMR